MPAEKNQIFETLFQSANEGILIVDAHGMIRNANPAVHDMFGYSESLEGKQVEILIPEDLRKAHQKHRSDYAKSPKSRSMGEDLELFGRQQNGNTFPVQVSLSPSMVDDQPVVIAFIIDITSRKQVEKQMKEYSQSLEERVEERTRELKESQKLYSAIARNFPDGMISVFDRDLRYVFVEGKELYALGITSEMLMGTNYLDRLAPEIAELAKAKLLEVFDGQAQSIEIKFRNNDYILDAAPIPEDDGKIRHILVIEKNITERKRSEEQVKHALEHERQINELKTRFVSTASHEFRTPLSTILSSVSLLDRYTAAEDQEKREKHIKRIKGSVHNLTGILNDFLSLDKLETGAVEGNPVNFEMPEFIKEVCDHLTPTLKREQYIRCDHSGDSSVFIDKQILNNILFNLLSNASKYSGGEPIDLHTSLKNGHLKIVVQDYGMGISEEDQQHLFERFFRSKSAINISGTGLGLNIVKKYIDLLGGEIDVNSTLGEGTIFTVTLNQAEYNEKDTTD